MPLTPVFNTGEVNVGVVRVLLVSICVPVNVVTVESIPKLTSFALPTVVIPAPPVNVIASLSRSMAKPPPESAEKSKSCAVT